MLARYQATLHPEGIGGTKVAEKTRNKQVWPVFFINWCKQVGQLARFSQANLINTSLKKSSLLYLYPKEKG
jgi:hypothetical protein